MSEKSYDAWPDAIANDDASLLWSGEKQFSTRDPREAALPKNHRKLQENHNAFNEYSRQNADAIDQFRPRPKHLLGKRRLFNCRSTRQLEEENSCQTNSA
jgi:hypothetical protein